MLAQLATLEASGLRHLEVAWSSHPGWSRLVEAIRSSFPSLALGAASVTERPALDDLERLALPYAMSPCWDSALQGEARSRGLLVVPGVFSPTEVMQAMQVGCRLVKLFPAATLVLRTGLGCISLGHLPSVIAAGAHRPILRPGSRLVTMLWLWAAPPFRPTIHPDLLTLLRASTTCE